MLYKHSTSTYLITLIFFGVVKLNSTILPEIPLGKYTSLNGIFQLHVEPASELSDCCEGKLENTKSEEIVWERCFLNAKAPMDCMVANSGKYVVTFDDWDYAENKHAQYLPIVVYGSEGSLLYVFTVRTLGIDLYTHKNWVETLDGYYQHKALVEACSYGTNWRDNSYIFWGKDQDTIFIRFSWGDVRVIDLKNGVVKTEVPHNVRDWYIQQIKERVSQLLQSNYEEGVLLGIDIVTHENFVSFIPELTRLLNSNLHSIHVIKSEKKKVYRVRVAAKTALEALKD